MLVEIYTAAPKENSVKWNKISSTPMAPGIAPSKNDDQPLQDSAQFRSVVGSLHYCTLTRPSMAYTINKLCQFLNYLTYVHWKAVKRLMRYLKRTLTHGIQLQKIDTLQLITYIDVARLGAQMIEGAYKVGVFFLVVLWSLGILKQVGFKIINWVRG